MPKRSLVEKAQSRRESGTFVALPSSVLESDNFRTLSFRANKALMCFCSQLRFYKGGRSNNGDLYLAHSIAKEWGLRSKETVCLAVKELLERGWIILTRQGGSCGMGPNLYAITFFAIDECGGKLQIPPTNAPPSNWKKWRLEIE